MAVSKRDYMETYDPLAYRYYNIILEKIKEEQMIYETLCDTSSKNKQQQANVTKHEIPK